ncbi:COG6 [Auxenochlorella protothecoides x Auxenochlorella symbiontica]
MAVPATAPGISRKVKKILDTRTDTPDLRACLESLSDLYPENTPAARRGLRSAIDNSGLEAATAFHAGLEGVLGALDAVHAGLDGLGLACRAAQDTLAATRASSAGLLAEHRGLRRQLEAARQRSVSLALFLQEYQLSPAEQAVLTQGEDVGPDFFGALQHVRAIHDNCRALMCGQHQRAGLELMESMAGLQEAAYERLCRWVRRRAAGLAEADALEVDPGLARAVAALRDRPVLLAYCMDEVAHARHAGLFQRFIKALTQGPRPIEMQAGDTRRYVGDMLAWLHAALELEAEFLGSLFGDGEAAAGDAAGAGSDAAAGAAGQASGAREAAGGAPEATGAATTTDGTVPTLQRVLDKVFESICRPLKVRLEQCLLSGPAPVLCFWVGQVLTFYLATVSKLLGPQSSLAETLSSVRALALRAFREQLRQRKDKSARYPLVPPKDLLPPQQLVKGAAMLAELVACHDAALDPASASAGADFEALLAAAAEPLLDSIERSSEALDPNASSRLDEGAHLDPSDRGIYLINCLALLLSQLEGAACAEGLAARIRLQLADHLSELVEAESARVLARCGLAEVAARIKLHQTGAGGDGADETPLSQATGLSLPAVADALRVFFGRLSAPDVLPEFLKLQLPRAREELIHRVNVTVADAHASVYEALHSPASGYYPAEVAAAVKHTPAHVRTLLGIH